MKKIAVITFYQTQDNYGQLLQCYALQMVLRKMGASPVVIQYGFHDKFFQWGQWQSYFTKLGLYSLKAKLKSTIRKMFETSKGYRHFDSFRKKHLKFSSRRYNSLFELQCHPPTADVYITGSDQVWAQLIDVTDNRSFFLDFGNEKVKRIAYAPSFAMDTYPDRLLPDLGKLLKRLNAISVREATGIDICKKIGVDASLVLDPTLLLTASDYDSILKAPAHDGYCFAYHVNIATPEELYWEDFKKRNKQNHLAVYATYANIHYSSSAEFLDEATYVYPTVEQWLGWIKHAKYVVTSSFHGIVFSILFHVPFIACLLNDSPMSGNNRVTTLLTALGLEGRIIRQEKDIDAMLSAMINWDEVEMKLNSLRSLSLSFLYNNI